LKIKTVCKQRDIAFNLSFHFEINSNLQEQWANSQPTPTHASGDHKFSAAAFGEPIENPVAAARPAWHRALTHTLAVAARLPCFHTGQTIFQPIDEYLESDYRGAIVAIDLSSLD